MTKRFSIRASDLTVRLSDIQARKEALRRELANLEVEEDSLQTFLRPYYDQGLTEVSVGNATFLVKISESERTYLNQKKAYAMIASMGKKAPTFKSVVKTFSVTKA